MLELADACHHHIVDSKIRILELVDFITCLLLLSKTDVHLLSGIVQT